MRLRFRRRSRPRRPQRFARERDALERLIDSTDNVAIAELARLRLRAARFADAHLTPTPDAAPGEATTPEAIEAELLRSLATTARPMTASDLPALAAHFAAMDRIVDVNATRRAEEAAREVPVAAPILLPVALPALGPSQPPPPRPPAPAPPKPRVAPLPRLPLSEGLRDVAFALTMTAAVAIASIALMLTLKGPPAMPARLLWTVTVPSELLLVSVLLLLRRGR